jgi:hypothetical protein
MHIKTFSFILVLFLIGITSAQIESLGIFEQNSCIKLIQTCSNCTYINISSVSYPNSTQALGQVSMTKLGTSYNYSCSPSDTLGTYIVNGFGDVDGVVTIFVYNYEVTINGTKPDSAGATIYAIVIIISFILFLSTFIWCLSTRYKFLKLGLGLGSYILLTWILFITWQLSYNYLNLQGLTNILRIFFIVTGIGTFPAFILAFMIILREIYIDIAENKLLERGVMPNDR